MARPKQNTRRFPKTNGFLLLVVLVAACSPSPSANRPQVGPSPAPRISVRVIVNFQTGRERFERTLQVSAPATVLQVLQECGVGEIDTVGTGETAFVKSIAGVANQGAGQDNWTYRVNRQLGKTSCGICPVQADDIVEWTLGHYDPNE